MHTALRYLVFPVVLLLVVGIVAAGCGGDDGDDGGSGDSTSTASTDDGDGGGEARSTFISTCGGCHTLDDAGTSGAVGPNLDNLAPSTDEVRSMIASGGGAMPANLLEGEEADAVAEYVSGAAGG